MHTCTEQQASQHSFFNVYHVCRTKVVSAYVSAVENVEFGIHQRLVLTYSVPMELPFQYSYGKNILYSSHWVLGRYCLSRGLIEGIFVWRAHLKGVLMVLVYGSDIMIGVKVTFQVSCRAQSSGLWKWFTWWLWCLDCPSLASPAAELLPWPQSSAQASWQSRPDLFFFFNF